MKKYGFYGLLNEKTTWVFEVEGEVELDTPALNISASDLPLDDYVWGRQWEGLRKEDGDEQEPFPNQDDMQFVTYEDNAVYSMAYLNEHGRCQPATEVSCPNLPTNPRVQGGPNGKRYKPTPSKEMKPRFPEPSR